MARYNIHGMGGKFWVQERVLWWWVDVLHLNLDGEMYRREFDDLDGAFAEAQRLRAQDCRRGQQVAERRHAEVGG